MLPPTHDNGPCTTPGATNASRRPAPRSLPATAHNSPLSNHSSSHIQSLAKLNRKPLQLTGNIQQRPNSIASFCRIFPGSPGHSNPLRRFLIDSAIIRNQPNPRRITANLFSNRTFFAHFGSSSTPTMRNLPPSSARLLTSTPINGSPRAAMLLSFPRRTSPR